MHQGDEHLPAPQRPLPVLLQDPVDDAGEPIELGPRRRLAAPVARRHRKAQHLRHRLRVDAEHPRRLPLAHPLDMAGAPNPRIQIHSLHLPRLPSTTGTESRRSALQFRAAAAGLPSRFREGVSLRRSQAADAVRARIDWKYALGLELTDPGFHFSVLAEFRARLVAGQAEHLLLDAMLERFKARGGEIAVGMFQHPTGQVGGEPGLGHCEISLGTTTRLA